MSKKNIKRGDTIVLTHDFKTDAHEFHKGDVCVITYKGLFDVDIELKGNPKVWATDVGYNDFEKIEE